MSESIHSLAWEKVGQYPLFRFHNIIPYTSFPIAAIILPLGPYASIQSNSLWIGGNRTSIQKVPNYHADLYRKCNDIQNDSWRH